MYLDNLGKKNPAYFKFSNFGLTYVKDTVASVPLGNFPGGGGPAGYYPGGTYPGGSYPAGTYPDGTPYPAGTYPGGSYPAGYYPGGVYPNPGDFISGGIPDPNFPFCFSEDASTSTWDFKWYYTWGNPPTYNRATDTFINLAGTKSPIIIGSSPGNDTSQFGAGVISLVPLENRFKTFQFVTTAQLGTSLSLVLVFADNPENTFKAITHTQQSMLLHLDAFTYYSYPIMGRLGTWSFSRSSPTSTPIVRINGVAVAAGPLINGSIPNGSSLPTNRDLFFTRPERSCLLARFN